jgi:hypothetical protein
VLQENGDIEVHLCRKSASQKRVARGLEVAGKPSSKKPLWELVDAAPNPAVSQAEAKHQVTSREMTDEEEFLLTARLRDFSASDWVGITQIYRMPC